MGVRRHPLRVKPIRAETHCGFSMQHMVERDSALFPPEEEAFNVLCDDDLHPVCEVTPTKNVCEYLYCKGIIGDVLLIAGKGHETGQLIGTETLPFDDASVANNKIRTMREALQ